MNQGKSILTISQYEWRRALARKKVALLILFTILVEFLPFAVITLLPLPSFIQDVSGIMWFIGALTPHFFFLQFVALLIGSGATAEEYGQGTADIILSKPISKMSYLIGKFLGGLTLFSFIALLTTILAILLSTFTFGAQSYLEFAPVVYFSLVFSTLVFFSFGFVMGEVFRSPTIAYLIASSIYIMSFILSPFLVFANSLTGDPFYLDISRALPTWSVQNFPIIISQELFLGFDSIPFISSGPMVGGTLLEAFTGILVYSSIGIVISFLRFLRTDVTKKSID